MKLRSAILLSCLILLAGLDISCAQHKCPAQTGGYVTPPPKVGKNHKASSGLWPKGMKVK